MAREAAGLYRLDEGGRWFVHRRSCQALEVLACGAAASEPRLEAAEEAAALYRGDWPAARRRLLAEGHAPPWRHWLGAW